jgi:hypothetical protein
LKSWRFELAEFLIVDRTRLRRERAFSIAR